MIGQWAVSLASFFVRNKNAPRATGTKKQGFGVTAADVSQTYHLLHQINMACKLSQKNTILFLIIFDRLTEEWFREKNFFFFLQQLVLPTFTEWVSILV